jgi:hypothetical protein
MTLPNAPIYKTTGKQKGVRVWGLVGFSVLGLVLLFLAFQIVING